MEAQAGGGMRRSNRTWKEPRSPGPNPHYPTLHLQMQRGGREGTTLLLLLPESQSPYAVPGCLARPAACNLLALAGPARAWEGVEIQELCPHAAPALETTLLWAGL